MSRSPTTKDKRVGYADSRSDASGWASYGSQAEHELDNPLDQMEEYQGSANPNATGAVARPVSDATTGRFENSNGYAQEDNELQCLDCFQPKASPDRG
jgi:hypothetical protein